MLIAMGSLASELMSFPHLLTVNEHRLILDRARTMDDISRVCNSHHILLSLAPITADYESSVTARKTFGCRLIEEERSRRGYSSKVRQRRP